MNVDFNSGVLVIILVELFRIEKRIGQGDTILKRLQRHCHLFNGGKETCEGKEQESEAGPDGVLTGPASIM